VVGGKGGAGLETVAGVLSFTARSASCSLWCILRAHLGAYWLHTLGHPWHDRDCILAGQHAGQSNLQRETATANLGVGSTERLREGRRSGMVGGNRGPALVTVAGV
jgi:hypothetical protein